MNNLTSLENQNYQRFLEVLDLDDEVSECEFQDKDDELLTIEEAAQRTSVYHELRKMLVARDIPEVEIAFVHVIYLVVGSVLIYK
jgi:hypothetical protein